MLQNLYQLVLHKLSRLPEVHLKQVDVFLSTLQQRVDHKEENRQKILALAGSWADLTEDEVEEIRSAGRKSGEELFGREVEW
jgi:hypothetical protein